VKVVHFTSLHNRYDSRVFHKQCVSLAQNHEVTLIVADGKGDEQVNNVTILDAGKANSTKNRIFKKNKEIVRMALDLKADLYQFHDPELNLEVKSFFKSNYKLIYDAHEDAPRQIVGNSKNKWSAKIKAQFIERYENAAAKKLNGIFAATEEIKERFEKFNSNVVVLKNYPIISDKPYEDDWNKRENALVYIGGISKHRGIVETIKAIANTDIRLFLAGVFQPANLRYELEQMEGWKNVEFYGMLSRVDVEKLLKRAKVGMLNLYPTPNHLISLPIKMFEYMMAGLPIVYSDVPKWRNVIQEGGEVIEYDNVQSIRDAIMHLIHDNDLAKSKGQFALNAVQNKYNWESEFQKLSHNYNKIVSS